MELKLTQADNPYWRNYMCVVFPTLMSYVPGGINYIARHSMDERVDAWIEQHQIAVTWLNRLEINYSGGASDKRFDPVHEAIKLSISGNLRVVRNNWKRFMKIMKWDYSDALWRRSDGRSHESWYGEWQAFQENIRRRYGAK